MNVPASSVVEMPDAAEVIIRFNDRELHLAEPVVGRIKRSDSVSFLIGADGYTETELEKPTYSKDDIDLVMMRAGVTEKQAAAKLQETKGDIALAIVQLSS